MSFACIDRPIFWGQADNGTFKDASQAHGMVIARAIDATCTGGDGLLQRR